MKIKFAITHAPSIGDKGLKRFWDCHALRFVDEMRPSCHFATSSMARESLKYAAEKVHGGLLNVEPVDVE